MSRPASLSLTLGALCACAGTLSASAEPASPPVFSPNPSVGWVVVLGGFKPPATGPGPVMADPKYPNVSNNQFRLTGKQPTLPLADLANPILQPWVREALAKRNAEVLAGDNILGPPHLC